MQGKIFCEAAFIGTTSTYLSPTRQKIWTRAGTEQLIQCYALRKQRTHLICVEPLGDGA